MTSCINPSWRGLIPAVAGLLLLAQVAWADIIITKVAGEGGPWNLAVRSSDATHRPPQSVRLTDHDVRFFFTETNGLGQPSQRLRYKLEGYENQWHELTTFTQMRMMLQYSDTNREIFGNTSFDIKGETPGWRATVEKSDFLSRSEHNVAPERAAEVAVVILSQGPESIIGMAAIDAVQLRVQPADKSLPAEAYDLSVTEGNDLSSPMGTPVNWQREGTHSDMAELQWRSTPQPHPVLVLNDSDPRRFCLWRTKHAKKIAVRPGDVLTLQWKEAHSIGCSGPGQASYTDLPPGHYVFRVAATRSDGSPTRERVALPIDLVLPFTRRVEFWLGMIFLSISLGIWLGWVTQKRRIKRRLAELERQQSLERERTRIARDLHDDVGSGLTEIAMRCGLAQNHPEISLPPEIQRQMDCIGQTASELTRRVDEIVWAVNPANDTLDSFANYLTQSSEQFLEPTGLGLRLKIPATLPKVEMNGKVRHDLLLAVREALNNVVKHAGATLIHLSLTVTNGTVEILIEDNGCGFEPGPSLPPGIHEGLTGMRLRLAEIGGQCRIESRPGGGTRVELSAPLQPTLIKNELYGKNSGRRGRRRCPFAAGVVGGF